MHACHVQCRQTLLISLLWGEMWKNKARQAACSSRQIKHADSGGMYEKGLDFLPENNKG